MVYSRKMLYAYDFPGFKTHHYSVPVIVIGNLTVGGTGKTPLIIHVYQLLKSYGFTPGIVSRGYIPKRKKSDSDVHWVTTESLASELGDEPVLLAQRLKCPIVVSSNRNRAVKALIHSKCVDIILSDDGLQHYAMGRNIEIAVIDGKRRFGNGYSLPLGPLREPINRLNSVDLIITNGVPFENNQYDMTFIPEDTHQLENFKHKTAHAVAGIGNPERFFQSLREHHIHVIPHVFPDHYVLQEKDLVFQDKFPIIMTEKDAVKCKFFRTDKHFVLRIQASVNPLFDARLLVLLREKK